MYEWQKSFLLFRGQGWRKNLAHPTATATMGPICPVHPRAVSFIPSSPVCSQGILAWKKIHYVDTLHAFFKARLA